MFKLIKTIKNEKRKVFDEVYEKHPKDENIVLKHRVVTEEIHLDKLNKQIEDIEAQLESLPVVQTYEINNSEQIKSLQEEKEKLLKIKDKVENI